MNILQAGGSPVLQAIDGCKLGRAGVWVVAQGAPAPPHRQVWVFQGAKPSREKKCVVCLACASVRSLEFPSYKFSEMVPFRSAHGSFLLPGSPELVLVFNGTKHDLICIERSLTSLTSCSKSSVQRHWVVRKMAFKHCVLQRLLCLLYRDDHLEQNLSQVLRKRFKLAFITIIKKKSISPTDLPKLPALSRWFRECVRSKEGVCQDDEKDAAPLPGPVGSQQEPWGRGWGSRRALGLSGCELLSDSVSPRSRALTPTDTGPLGPLPGPPWSPVGSSDPVKACFQKRAREPVCQPLMKPTHEGHHEGLLPVESHPVSYPAWHAGRACSTCQILVHLYLFVHFCSLCMSKLHPSSGWATPNLSSNNGVQLNLYHAVSTAQMGK